MRFDYIAIAPLLPSHRDFFFVFGCRISFLVGSSLFVDGCSAVSCDFGVFVRGGQMLTVLIFIHYTNILLLRLPRRVQVWVLVLAPLFTLNFYSNLTLFYFISLIYVLKNWGEIWVGNFLFLISFV